MSSLREQIMRTGLLHEAAFIDGTWQDLPTAPRLAVNDPASGDVVGHVPICGQAETARAIAAAARVQPAWAVRTAADRAVILRRLFTLMNDRADDLALVLSAEQGKPLAEARGEITYAAAFVEWFAEEARRLYGEVIPGHAADKRLLVLRQPVGVVAAITPWNFPAAMVTRKLAPALAAGCTVVLKPAEATPFTALALADLAQQAGVPSGVINVVTGDPVAIGAELTGNALVRKLSFTGSTRIGKLLQQQCAASVKKVSLELGGNAPFIVFDDADLDAAVEGALQSKFRNCGQTCVSANRFYVQDGIHDAFVAALAERTAKLAVGPGRQPGAEIGPLIDARALAKVEEHLADAVNGGAIIHTGGKRHVLGGTFYEPTVASGITAAMLLAREETFGPLAGVIRFADEAEVIAQANASEFGLAAYFYSRDISRVWRVAEALEAGMIGINTGLISTEVAPFGGIKQSGLGREGSRHGLDDYTELKYLCLAV